MDSTAVAGSDYTDSSQTVTLTQVAPSSQIPLVIINDNVVEISEVFFVNASTTDSQVVLQNSPLSITILDDDSKLAFAKARLFQL